MQNYLDLLQHILDNGTDKTDRTGTGTRSVFGYQLRYDLSKGFPLVTTKKVHLKSIIYELLWFLKGDTNIKYLVDNDCHIWDGDCYQAYLKECERLKKDEDFTILLDMTAVDYSKFPDSTPSRFAVASIVIFWIFVISKTSFLPFLF